MHVNVRRGLGSLLKLNCGQTKKPAQGRLRSHEGRELLLVDEPIGEEYAKLTVGAGLPKKGGNFNFHVGHQGLHGLHLYVALNGDLNYDRSVLRSEDVAFEEVIPKGLMLSSSTP